MLKAGLAAIHYAAQYDDLSTMKQLVDLGADLASRDEGGNSRTPLLWALALYNGRGGAPSKAAKFILEVADQSGCDIGLNYHDEAVCMPPPPERRVSVIVSSVDGIPRSALRGRIG